MSLGIGSRFHSFDFSLAIKYEVSYHIGYLASLFLSYPMSLGIRELAHWRDIGFRDHGGSWDIRMVLD